MKTYLTLLMFLLRSQLGNKGKRKNTLYVVGRVALILLVVLYCWGMLLPGSYFAFGLFPKEAAGSLLGAYFSLLLIFSVLIGLRIGYSLFASSRDLPFLLSLPIPHQTVFAARMTAGYFSELSIISLFTLPVMIGYWMRFGTIAGVLSSLFLLLLLPLFSLSISSLLSLVTVRLTRFFRRGEMIFTVLSTVLIVGATFAMQMGILSVAKSEGQLVLQNLESISTFLERFGSFFPPGIWASEAITHPFQLGFWLFMLCTALLTALLIYAGGRLYSHGAIVISKNTRKRGKVVINERQRSTLFSIIRRDLRMMLRSPTYAINLLSPFFVGPIVIASTVFSSGAEGHNLASTISQYPMIGFYITAGIVCFICSMNMIGSTAMSREGRAIWLAQTIPVSPTAQIAAKLLMAVQFSLLEAIVSVVMILVVFRISVASALVAGIAGFLASIAPLAISAFPDFYRPKLSWETEQQAVKNNFNAIIGMFLSWLLLLPQVAIFVLCGVFKVSIPITVVASIVLSLLEIAIVAALVPRVASASFQRLSAR